MQSSDSVRFTLSVLEGDSTLLLEGSQVVGDLPQLKGPIDIALTATAELAAHAHSKPDSASEYAETRDAVSNPSVTQPIETISKPQDRVQSNLTLDVQPFTEREQVEGLWINGKKQAGSFPLALTAQRGLQTIRWKIGDDFWTDTVSVGGEPVEKNLVFEHSLGRVNVTASFADGPGYADIWLDGRETGQGTPGELRNVPAGPHEIELIRDGYRMNGGPHIIRVPANDRVRVSLSMVPK
jgi:hypothetical protein